MFWPSIATHFHSVFPSISWCEIATVAPKTFVCWPLMLCVPDSADTISGSPCPSTSFEVLMLNTISSPSEMLDGGSTTLNEEG